MDLAKLGKGMGVGKEWPYKILDEIAPGAPEKAAKYSAWGQ